MIFYKYILVLMYINHEIYYKKNCNTLMCPYCNPNGNEGSVGDLCGG